MKRLILLLFLFSSFVSLAQVSYSGTVKDSIGAIEFANIIFYDSEGNIIKGTVSDKEGDFALMLEGANKIVVSYIGYNRWEKTLNKKEDQAFGEILLQREDGNLNEVLITAEKPLIERIEDKIIFNVKNSIVASGNDALAVLQNTPRIDPTSEELKIIGKSGVMVMVNDRMLNLTGSDLNAYLKSLRSENIERIELFLTPPAKYDASGNSGLINIVLKNQQLVGFDGNVNATYIQRTKPGFMPSGNLFYSSDKFSASLNLFGDQEIKIYDSETYIDYGDGIRASNVQREDDVLGGSSNLTMNYEFNDKLDIGLNGNYSSWETVQRSTSEIQFASNQRTDSILYQPSGNENRYNYSSLSGYLDYKIDTLGTELKFEYNFLQKNAEDDRELYSFLEDEAIDTEAIELLTTSDSKYEVNSFRTDLSMPLKESQFDVGAKVTFLTNNSNFTVISSENLPDISDFDNRNDKFNYDETIWAGYISFEKSWSKKVYSKIGLRYEHTLNKGNSISLDSTFQNEFDNFFPSAFLSYNLNDNNSVSLGYSKRIDRPIFYNVNPYPNYVNFSNIIQGNPYLLPSIVHNVEFSYIFKNNFTLDVYSSILKDGADYLTFTNPTDLGVISRPLNYYSQRTFGMNISYNLRLNRKFNSYNSFNAYYNNSKSDLPQLTINELDGYGFFLISRNNFRISSKSNNRIFLNLTHKFPSTEGLMRVKTRSDLQLGIALELIKQKLDLNLSFRDILYQAQAEVETEYPDFSIYSNSYSDVRNMNVSVTYKFGNKKSKVSQRSIDDSEKQRLN